MNDRHPYHHGALRQALIGATEDLLAELGPEAFSLREVARRAGVSPAAPAHHFGDAAGLLTAVASLGFAELTRSLREGDARGGADALAALREQGVEYVAFALRRPGLFRLMFRQGRLREDAELEQHAQASYGVLAEGVRRAAGVRSAAAMRPAHWQAVTALWSLVHGYAHLAIAGKFDPMCGPGGLPAFVGDSLRPVLDAILGSLFQPLTAKRGTRAARTAPSRTGGSR
ncbi:MAG: TetR/AcrR family transcriptional regulator [Rubrivivax sp.]|nr:TetR/AcrR family transcriptional regulator [Rubrivivax sp.]